MSGTGSRSRSLARQFIFLREDEAAVRTPNATQFRDLEESGRVQEIKFNNNATASHVMELVAHKFSMNRDDASR